MADEVVGVEESSEYNWNTDAEFKTFEMTVFGYQVDHRIYAPNETDALEAAKVLFSEAIGQVLKVKSQLAAMEHDEEEY